MANDELRDDLNNVDDILKFLESEIRSFEEMFDELSGK